MVFTDPKWALALEKIRWHDGLICLRCESQSVHRLHSRPGHFWCAACNYQYSVIVGTPFHHSHVELGKWFLAAYLLHKVKPPPSALALSEKLDVSYETAWSIKRKILELSTSQPEFCAQMVTAYGDALLATRGAASNSAQQTPPDSCPSPGASNLE